MQNFTPYSALFGGMLIGLAAAVLMFFNGRIAGISSIFRGMLFPKAQDLAWRIAFVLGLILAPFIMSAFGYTLEPVQFNSSTAAMLASGLLVGYGTTLANGCTSGHGICGITRLSLRSMVATLIFMTCAGITVYLMLHQLNPGQ